MKTMNKQFPFRKPRLEALKKRLERSEAVVGAQEMSPNVSQEIPFERWLVRMGISPQSGMGVSRTGLYTDFT